MMSDEICRTVRYSLTPHVIRCGLRASNGNCPVAIESRRLVPRAAVNVLPEKITFAAGGVAYVVPLPREATLWIRDYDSGKPVGPIEFFVKVPEVLFFTDRSVA